MVNQKYALGVNSCSSAIMLALMAVGVEPGDQVITNGFTFTALPSTIMRLGAEPVLVEATKSWIMDLDDLEKKIAAFPDAEGVAPVAHARQGRLHGPRRRDLREERHYLGRGLRPPAASRGGASSSATTPKVTAYSTQSDKVINSGEGGFVTTDDDEIAAKMIYLSGCYGAATASTRSGRGRRPPRGRHGRDAQPQLPHERGHGRGHAPAHQEPAPARRGLHRRYDAVVKVLREEAGDVIVVPTQDERVGTVGDHLNFYLTA